MRKFFAVVKREYIQRVRTKFFVIATILGPVMMAAFTVVPAIMFGMNAGGPMRLAIVDQTGKMYGRVAKELETAKDQGDENEPSPQPMQPRVRPRGSKEQIKQARRMTKGNFVLEEVRADKRSFDELKREP